MPAICSCILEEELSDTVKFSVNLVHVRNCDKIWSKSSRKRWWPGCLLLALNAGYSVFKQGGFFTQRSLKKGYSVFVFLNGFCMDVGRREDQLVRMQEEELDLQTIQEREAALRQLEVDACCFCYCCCCFMSLFFCCLLSWWARYFRIYQLVCKCVSHIAFCHCWLTLFLHWEWFCSKWHLKKSTPNILLWFFLACHLSSCSFSPPFLFFVHAVGHCRCQRDFPRSRCNGAWTGGNDRWVCSCLLFYF